MKHFLNVIFEALAEMQKVRVATALARMGLYEEAKESIR